MDDDGSNGRAYGTDDLAFDDTDSGRARDRGNFGQRSGGDVMMNDLSTDKTADPHVSKRKSPGGKKRGKNRRQEASQWLKHNTVPPPK